MKRKDGSPYYKLILGSSIPREFVDFARRRIGGLSAFDQTHRSLQDLLANAYIIGLSDALEVLGEEITDKSGTKIVSVEVPND